MDTSTEAYYKAWTSGLLDSMDKKVLHIVAFMGGATTNEIVIELQKYTTKRISDRQVSSSTSRLQKQGRLKVEQVVVQSNTYKARRYILA